MPSTSELSSREIGSLFLKHCPHCANSAVKDYWEPRPTTAVKFIANCAQSVDPSILAKLKPADLCPSFTPSTASSSQE